MLRLTAGKTYRILYFILNQPLFSQTEIKEKLGISIGRVNKVITWLKDREYVTKDKKGYRLVKPNKLAEIIALHNSIKKQFTFDVKLSKTAAIKFFKKINAVFCLDSALESYDKSKEASEIYVYQLDEKLISELNKLERGNLRVNVYQASLTLDLNIRQNTTTDIRTIIDFHTVGKPELAKKIAEKIWKTKQ